MTRECFVYVLSDAHGAKIGVAASVEARRDALQIGNPRRIGIMFVSIPLVNLMAYAVERAVHKRLSGCRMEGEWFNVSVVRAEELVQECITAMLFGACGP